MTRAARFSRCWRSFARRHPALIICAAVLAPLIVLDRTTNLHALAMVLTVYVALSIADAWDEDTK